MVAELQEGDALVLNNTRVLPARLHGVKPDTGGHIEVAFEQYPRRRVGNARQTREAGQSRYSHLFRGWTLDGRGNATLGTRRDAS